MDRLQGTAPTPVPSYTETPVPTPSGTLAPLDTPTPESRRPRQLTQAPQLEGYSGSTASRFDTSDISGYNMWSWSS
jgi:hypothetical protein